MSGDWPPTATGEAPLLISHVSAFFNNVKIVSIFQKDLPLDSQCLQYFDISISLKRNELAVSVFWNTFPKH